MMKSAGPAGPPTRSPPWWAAWRSSSSMSPDRIALVGHTSSHARGRLAGRSPQYVHLDILPSAPNWGTPNGQAQKQSMQPTHLAWFTDTTPSSALVMAATGQDCMHGALSQCRHGMERLRVVTFGYEPASIFAMVRHDTAPVWFHVAQATSHAWQPVHLLTSKSQPFLPIALPITRGGSEPCTRCSQCRPRSDSRWCRGSD